MRSQELRRVLRCTTWAFLIIGLKSSGIHPVTEARIVFVKQLQQSLDVTTASTILEASFHPTMENVIACNFRYVTFAMKSQTDKAKLEDYIVFESIRPKAEALVQAFAMQRYGDKLQEITVYPPQLQTQGRALFYHGKILAMRCTKEKKQIPSKMMENF